MSNHEELAYTVKPINFTDKHNALRVVRKPASTLVSVVEVDGALILTFPQTGLKAIASRDDVHFI